MADAQARRFVPIMKPKTALVMFLLAAAVSYAHAQESPFKIEKFMTPEELRETGVSNLTPKQREALDQWLARYTRVLIATARSSRSQGSNVPDARGRESGCTPAIESNISGDFEGWDGETIFKLDNGQIWQQAEYDYTYEYDYNPEVTIYQTSTGCRMKVEGTEETILVRRIK